MEKKISHTAAMSVARLEITRPDIINPVVPLAFLACDRPTIPRTIAIIPGIKAKMPTQGIKAISKARIPRINEAIPNPCPAFVLTGSSILMIF